MSESIMIGERISKRKILTIDDSYIILRTVHSILSNQYELVMANDAKMGIVKAIENRPELILLDYEMPGMSGVEVLKSLRENPLTKNIPVIFLTSVSDTKLVKDALVLKPEGYVLKPIDTNKLIKTVEDALK